MTTKKEITYTQKELKEISTSLVFLIVNIIALAGMFIILIVWFPTNSVDKPTALFIALSFIGNSIGISGWIIMFTDDIKTEDEEKKDEPE